MTRKRWYWISLGIKVTGLLKPCFSTDGSIMDEDATKRLQTLKVFGLIL